MNLLLASPEKNLVMLSEREREYLVRAIESGLYVRKRHQFFLWAQGQLHGILPHELLICLRLDDDGHVLQMECFNSCLLDEERQEVICHPANGIAVRLARLCGEHGSPLILACGDEPHQLELGADFRRWGLRNAMVCASDYLFGSICVFVLFDLKEGPTQRHAYLLELMLPHLQIALLRLLTPSSSVNEPRIGNGSRLITAREVEILRLVQQGKSNQDIGAALGISPLTVKNHVQRIYRKLNVQNRAHAVSRGISLRLLDSAAGLGA